MISRTSFSFIVIIALMLLMIIGCAKKESDYQNASADTATFNGFPSEPSGNALSSSAAIENKKDTMRKFIRTADIKFRVKDVIQATYQIEDATAKLGGFVTYTHLYSQLNNHTFIKVRSDSSLESTTYTVVNRITLRVPNTQLDNLLKSIAPIVDYMDYRTIKADDIALQLLTNKLTERRVKQHEKRVTDAIKQHGKELWETTDAEDNLIYKQETADNAYMANLTLMDQVSYSTVTLDLYQKEVIKHELIANEKNIEIYEAGFGSKFMDSLHDGWKILEAFILFLTKIWGLLLFAGLLLIVIRKYKGLLKKDSKKQG